MVMLRLVFSAVLLLLIARPALRGHSRDGWLAVVGFGVVLAVMNGLFYLALERLPLGVTVTIEVLGPLVLSIVASRRRVGVAVGAARARRRRRARRGRVGPTRSARRRLRARRRGELGVLHPRVGAGRPRVPPAGRARARDDGRRPHRAPVRHRLGGCGAPAPRTPRPRRGRRRALVDDPVRARAHRAPPPAGIRVRDPDESRPGDRGARRLAAARAGARVARDRGHRRS